MRCVDRAKLAWRALLLASAVAITGCASVHPVTWFADKPDTTVNTRMTPDTVVNASRASVVYERDPRNVNAAITYARALRELGSNKAAADALARTVAFHPDNAELVGEYAKALTASGDNKSALEAFKTAETLGAPDWQLLSAEGIALDQLGRHEAARDRYAAALRLSPDNPDVLCNLALSQTLSGNLSDAELILRRAVRQPGAGAEARQNLALVLGLRGRFSEAEGLERGDLDQASADHNVAVLKAMFAQPELWTEARQVDDGPDVASIANPGDVMNDAAVSNPPTAAVVPVTEAALPDLHASGITAAIRPAKAHPHASLGARSQSKAAVRRSPQSNGVDETFFAFGW